MGNPYLNISNIESPIGEPILKPLNLSAITPIPDHFTKHAEPVIWMALGDSFTAAPGTGWLGGNRKCLRSRGSYAWQMHTPAHEFPFTPVTNPARPEKNSLHFWACTGYKTFDVIGNTLPALSALQTPYLDFMVMTLGGNDIKFADISHWCLLEPWWWPFNRKHCEKAKTFARGVIGNRDLEIRMRTIYNGLFSKMGFDDRHQVYHILYPTFFDVMAGSEWCAETGFTGSSQRLTLELRNELNQLTYDLNDRIKQIANDYNRDAHAKGYGARIITIDPNAWCHGGSCTDIFWGHRFCDHRPSPHQAHRRLITDDVWFMAYTGDSPLQVETSKREVVGSSTHSDVHNATASNGTERGTVGWPEWLTKTFHPKTAAFTAIKEALQHELQWNR